MKRAPGYEKSCATCAYETKLTQPLHYMCIGCVKDGACTKWEEKPKKAE